MKKPEDAKVDIYPNEQYNATSKFPIQQYEENEAPPPRFDTHGGK